MKTRLSQIMAAKNLTAASLAKILQIQPSGISHILTGRNNPNLQFIQKMLEAFPDINAKWLINGDEPMFEKNDPPSNAHQVIDIDEDCQNTDSAQDVIENPFEQILSSNQDKKISRIVIFYSDRSFVDYRPE